MTQKQMLARLQRAQWRALERIVRRAYHEGYESGMRRAHGQRRRGRTIRADATVGGLLRLLSRHFGLDRYGFEIRIVHAGSKKHVPLGDQLVRYRVED